MVFMHSQANAQGKSQSKAENIFVDLILTRPLGIVACAFGTAGTIISLPFLAFNPDLAAPVVDNMLTKPGDYTFIRPVGNLDNNWDRKYIKVPNPIIPEKE